ncbi:MAG TPA: helix-turn-helix transcriptional regulator, partial [Coriobacteriia bacterium]|nr:helix-turn-helix transcriptional regulator [Coriobacteriia bacterium]
LVIAALIGRDRHLSDYRWLYYGAPILMSLATGALLFTPFSFSETSLAYLLSIFLGIAEAVLWILWGERYACIKANYSIKHIGTVFGLTLLVTITLSMVLPAYVSSFFVMLLPLASGGLLLRAIRDGKTVFPRLLPKRCARVGLREMVIICLISFLASIACYFLAAIIPWEVLPAGESSFSHGIIGGALLMLVISGICMVPKSHLNIFALLPWLLVIEVAGFAFFLADGNFFLPAFILAIAVSSIFEILLIMYFGILTTKGYVTPALAFSFSCGFIRAGIGGGNTLAIAYEHNPDVAAAITPETCLLFIVALMIILIPLVRQEFSIAELMSSPPKNDEVKTVCLEMAKEFGLSERECEILILISSGHTSDSIAKKLVLSPYTVNTHIRHIYDKTRIHKRSELLNYINMQRSDF